MADDGCRGPGGSVAPAGAGGGQALDEFDFTDRAHLLRSVAPVHRSCLDKHGGTDVVTGADIGGQLVEEIPLVGEACRPEVPEVVMGVANGDLWLQGGFLG